MNERVFDIIRDMDIEECVERCVSAVGALDEVDLDVLSDVQLDETLTALVLLAHRLQRSTCRVAARWDGRSVWTSDESRSARARLARDTHTSRSTAGTMLRRARALEAMPLVADALTAGVLSTDHVDLLAAACSDGRETLMARDEEHLVQALSGLRFDECIKVVDYWRQCAEQELNLDDPPPDLAPSTATMGAGVGAEVHLVAHLDPLDGATVNAALQRLMDELRRADRDTGRPRRGTGQLRAAALVEMARRAMAAPSGIRSSRPLVSVICGEASFAHLCELASGRVLAPNVLVPHLDQLDVQTIVFDGPFKPIEATRRRAFTGVLRRAIEARDRHCQHSSGCDEPIDACDVDHIIPWSAGGETSPGNGRLLCRFHNRINAAGTRPPAQGERNGADLAARPPPLTG